MNNNLPTFQDITPTLGMDLDERSAAKNFFGKTRDEAKDLFEVSAIHYGEDLCWMGPRAFRYYFPAYELYVKSSSSYEDWSVVTQLIVIINVRIRISGQDWVWEIVSDCVQYCINNIAKFGLGTEQSEVLDELVGFQGTLGKMDI